MAQQGFYRDPPNRRMAYDEDGSIVVIISSSGTISQQDTTAMRNWNTEAHTNTHQYGIPSIPPYFAILFPELRDVSHAYRNLTTGTYVGNSYNGTYETSINTTNGLDGNWVATASFTASISATNPNFRGDSLMTVGAAGVKGIRHTGPSPGTYSEWHHAQWHVYGNKSAGQTPHRLDFCDSAGNDLLIDLDYGDQPRSSERIWSPSNTWNQSSAVYLKNRSSTKQATDVNITHEVITSDFSNFITLSKDNVTYGTTVNYTTINPQQIVGPIYVKHNPTISATLGVKAARLQVAVGTWL